ncbi:DUF6221 family protein [Nocardioides sediminis]|uniref:DUF6221 family protein n=1 Tax=Nocardioides sediminis TaxID=433648 RepID=UPI003899289A
MTVPPRRGLPVIESRAPTVITWLPWPSGHRSESSSLPSRSPDSRHRLGPFGHPDVGLEVNDAEVERRFLDRAALLQRVQTDRALVALNIEAMQDEQGTPAAGASSFESGPVTRLGSEVLKVMTARYADHSDYRFDWRPSVQLPRL